MPAKRTTISRQQHWRITPTAISIWKIILELQSHPRDAHGELSEENRVAERDAAVALAAEMGFCKFTIEPHRIDGDEPWRWIADNSVQLERWHLGWEIRNALNRALMEETQRLRTAAKQRRAPGGDKLIARAQEPEPKAP